MSSTTQTSDSIEFHCTGCGRALKVPAAAAGKRASCPQCQAIVEVPVAFPSPTARATVAPTPPQPAGTDRHSSGQPVQPPPVANNPASVAWALPPQPPAAPPPPAHAPAGTKPGPAEPAAPAAAPELRPPKIEGRDTPTRQLFDRITAEIAKIYVGQDELVLGALVALFSSGHVLIEAVPGLGKTLFVRALG